MKSRILTAAAAFAAVLMLSVPVVNARDLESNGSGGGDWDDTNSWKDTSTGNPPASKPDANDSVTIKSGDEIDVDTTPEYADNITVESGGTLDIEGSCTLTLDGSIYSTSYVYGSDGVRLQGANSILRFVDRNQTVSGSGEILGVDDEAQIQIGNAGTTITLTLASATTIEGTLHILAGPAASVPMTFINNGTVWANGTDVLDIDPDVLGGSGKWWVTTSNAELEFSKGSTSLTGEFTVSNGKLKIQDNVETTDNLTFNGGQIDVTANKRFVANK
jgi:hypothetical protein